MSYDYNGFVIAIAQEIAITPTNADFLTMLPTFIQNAELRIYRDLDLLSTVFRDPNGVATVNQRSVTLPQTYGRFVVVEGVNVFVSAARHAALVPVSRDFLDVLYPSETPAVNTAIPLVFSRDTDATILVGPAPGSAAAVTAFEVVGTVRPASLSGSNTTTFISQYLPDLFLSAAMVEAAGWMKNYGAQADDPKLAISWDTVYQSRLTGASVEENRKKFQAGSWASKNPVNVQPDRG
jgi:hypothetical protein